MELLEICKEVELDELFQNFIQAKKMVILIVIH